MPPNAVGRASICNTKRYWRILIALAKTGDFAYFQPLPLLELAEFSNSAESAPSSNGAAMVGCNQKGGDCAAITYCVMQRWLNSLCARTPLAT
jgi:hypothetical protein